MSRKPRIMFFDIETCPNVVYSWRIGHKIDLSAENLIEERRIICICWKYLGEKDAYYLTWDKNQCDKSMLEAFGKELNDCDAAIGHNGDHFDIKWVKTRNLIHGLPPLTNIQTVDTLKLARNNFNFNSNRLDYIGDILKVGRKSETGGYKLWTDTMNGSKKALDGMVNYCINDVYLLEKVFKKLSIYSDKMPINIATLSNGDRNECPACGGSTRKFGIRYNKSHAKQRYICRDCSHTFSDTRKLK